MKLSKRCFDLSSTIIGLLIIWPILFIVAISIMLDDRGPVFFRQERVGLNGKLFRMWKFRTMIVDAEKVGKQITVGRDPRITRVGHILRMCKLDEFPQLFNVVLGEMSLVGPRPEVPYYVNMYTEEQRKVLELMPGITDLASIKYKDESDVLAASNDPELTYTNEIMPEKIRINLEYGKHASVIKDFSVIINTLLKIVR